MLILGLSGVAALAGIAYAIYLWQDEKRRQEWRQASRAVRIKE